MAGVFVLSADMSVLAFVDWQRAVTLLCQTNVRGIPMALCFEADPERTVRSPSTQIPFPRVIQFLRPSASAQRLLSSP